MHEDARYDIHRVIQRGRTMDVHPTLLRLDRAVLLNFVDAVAQGGLDRFVQHLAEVVCVNGAQAMRELCST